MSIRSLPYFPFLPSIAELFDCSIVQMFPRSFLLQSSMFLCSYFKGENKNFHPHRAPHRGCDHRDSGSHAAAGTQRGTHQGKSIACLNNLKQAGQIAQFYINDNDSWAFGPLAGAIYSPAGNANYQAYGTLLYRHGYIPGKYLATGGYHVARYMTCPTVKEQSGIRLILQDGLVNSLYTYGIAQYAYDSSGKTIVYPDKTFKTSQPAYSRPSNFPYFMDSANGTASAAPFPWYTWDCRNTNNAKPAGVHAKLCNVAFLDGHAGANSRGELHSKYKIANFAILTY